MSEYYGEPTLTIQAKIGAQIYRDLTISPLSLKEMLEVLDSVRAQVESLPMFEVVQDENGQDLLKCYDPESEVGR
jgi:hypothetical protein